MVKQAMFNIIQFDIYGKRVLDLFSGTGQLAFEAISRGASTAVLVERDNLAVKVIKQNIESLSLTSKVTIESQDCFMFLSGTRYANTFGLVFIDPPYGKDLVVPACKDLEKSGALTGDAIVVVKAERKDNVPETIAGLTRKQYFYGKTAISVYRLP